MSTTTNLRHLTGRGDMAVWQVEIDGRPAGLVRRDPQFRQFWQAWLYRGAELPNLKIADYRTREDAAAVVRGRA